MLFRNMWMKYHDEAGADGAAGGGAGAGDTQKTYTQAEVEELINERTNGLRQQRDSLMDEKKNAQREADLMRMETEKENAKKTGRLEEFEKSLRSTFEKEKEPLVAKLTALESRVLGESKKAILGGFVADFIAPESVDVIGQLVKTELDGDTIKTQFTDFAGNVITTDPAEFKKWMAKHPAISHLMKADAASGGGAMGGKNSSGGAGQVKYSVLKDLPVR